MSRVLQKALRAIETANPDKLYGIFEDVQWTNKDRLTDAMLHDLIEHFSSLELTEANLPEDELIQGYEYLIKKFADDSGHTAAEFYTNRTIVQLMTEMLQPQSRESFYDPTCGSGGMLHSCIAQLRRQVKEWRNVRLCGQERNLMTSSIARMNRFLHGIEDFRIERVDTLSEPKFVQGDRLMQFDVVLANPQWKILFINAVDEVTHKRAQRFLTGENIWNIIKAYNNFKEQTFFSIEAKIKEVKIKRYDLIIPRYVGMSKKVPMDCMAIHENELVLNDIIMAWLESSGKILTASENLIASKLVSKQIKSQTKFMGEKDE